MWVIRIWFNICLRFEWADNRLIVSTIFMNSRGQSLEFFFFKFCFVKAQGVSHLSFQVRCFMDSGGHSPEFSELDEFRVALWNVGGDSVVALNLFVLCLLVHILLRLCSFVYWTKWVPDHTGFESNLGFRFRCKWWRVESTQEGDNSNSPGSHLLNFLVDEVGPVGKGLNSSRLLNVCDSIKWIKGGVSQISLRQRICEQIKRIGGWISRISPDPWIWRFRSQDRSLGPWAQSYGSFLGWP